MNGKPIRLLLLSNLVLAVWANISHGDEGQFKNRYTSYPQVRNISEGISWPQGQALPIFATTAGTLDAIDVRSLTPDEQITFSALQGQVNRKRPRILLVDSRTDEGRDTWADTPIIGFGARNHFDRESKYDLLAKYAGEVTGIVLYDAEASPHYRNLACTVAGLHRALPATTQVVRRMKDRGIELKVVADLTELELSTPIEIYDHLHKTYWTKCEKRVIVSARPDSRGGDLHHTRDIAAACGAAVVWLDCRKPDEKAVLRKFLGDMQAGNAVVLGWYSTERSGITTASEFGIGTLPADHYMSPSVFSGTDHRIRIPEVPKRHELENKIYVAIFLSDGDNIQYAQRAMRRIWDQSKASRGKVALNWTIAPGLVDIGPGILNYYYTTATPEDCFVTGPSGMGYMMPFNTLNEPGAPVGLCLADADRMDGYAKLTETYLQRSGLRVVTIWDDVTAAQRASYAKHCRSLYGATVHNFKDVPSVAASVEENRVRFDKLIIPYVGTYRHIRESLDAEIQRWDGKSPLFLSYQVAIWNEMKPDRIVELAEAIREKHGDKVAFVRADHYFNLYNEAHGLPFNLGMSDRTKVTSSDEAANSKHVTDGTSATSWSSSQAGTKWLEFAFGSDFAISWYVIRHAETEGGDARLKNRNVTIQTSSDGITWATVDAFKDNSDAVIDVDLAPVTARYLKFAFDDSGKDSTIGIADVEIYGSKKN